MACNRVQRRTGVAVPFAWVALLAAASALVACGARTVVPSEAGDGEAGTSRCVAGEAACGGICTDVSINPFHCGACDRRCGAGEECLQGICRMPCRSPLQTCAAGCADVQTDPANCGGCGRRCDPGANCASGRCRSANEPTYVLTRMSTGSWIDACGAPGGMRQLMSTDDNAVPSPLPFALRYWGATLPAGQPVNVCSNGWIGLDGVHDVALTGMLGSMNAPNSVVAAHWGDLFTRAGGICIATVGTSPNRSWVVEWDDAHYCCNDDPMVHLTFEIVIHETSGVIDLAYNQMAGARPAFPAGIENSIGDTAVTSCAGGGPCDVSGGNQLRFTPVN